MRTHANSRVKRKSFYRKSELQIFLSISGGHIAGQFTFFLNWKQRTAGKAVEDAMQYIKMYVAGV